MLFLRDDRPELDDDLRPAGTRLAEEENGFSTMEKLGRRFGGGDGPLFDQGVMLAGSLQWDTPPSDPAADAIMATVDAFRELQATKSYVAFPEAPNKSVWYRTSAVSGHRLLPWVVDLNKRRADRAIARGSEEVVSNAVRDGFMLAEYLGDGCGSARSFGFFATAAAGAFELASAAIDHGVPDAELAAVISEGCDLGRIERYARAAVVGEYQGLQREVSAAFAQPTSPPGGATASKSAAVPGHRSRTPASVPGRRWEFKPNRTVNLAADAARTWIEQSRQPVQGNRDLLGWERKTTPGGVAEMASGNAEGIRLIQDRFSRDARFDFLQRSGELRTMANLVATKLALRRYQADHGELPAGLEELVPRYLDSVPTDWMDGAPLRYDPAHGLIWSVGSDLYDDGGDWLSNADACLHVRWTDLRSE